MTSGTFTLSTTVRVKAKRQSAGAAGGAPYYHGEGISPTITVGTGSGYADYFIERTVVIPALSSVTLDLYAGTDLKSIEDTNAPLAAVKLILVWLDADTGDTSGVRVGPSGVSNGWLANFRTASDYAVIYPGGPAWQAGSPAGITVSSTSKNLKLENLGAVAATASIKIAGSSSTSGMLIGMLGMTYP